LDKVRKIRPDLVLVNLKMPGLGGMEVLERINEIDPNIVSVVITAYAIIVSAVEAMKRHAYDFLTKPFTGKNTNEASNKEELLKTAAVKAGISEKTARKYRCLNS
jgi:two-component system response regulator GlrR